MSKSWLGHDLNDDPNKGSEQGNPDGDPADGSGPPPTEPNVKRRPDEVTMAALPPEIRSLVEKVIADKVNAERNFRGVDQRLRETETKLNQLNKEKQEAEDKRLAEQGQFKELAEKAEARAKDLEEKLVQREIQLNLDRELASFGAIDTETVSTLLMVKYGDELKADPSKVASLVARAKEEKPLLFKAPTPQAPAAPQTPPVQSTGQSGNQPPPGQTSPTAFNARDKKVSLAEVEKQYTEMMKNAEFPVGNSF